MKKLEVKQFDETQEEIVDALIALGMSKNIAKTLASLQSINESPSIELEKGAGLSQPEVSIVIKQLKERKRINEREEKKPGKGRPMEMLEV